MKQNKKQIEANLRNKLAAQYKEKTEQLKSEKALLEKRYKEMWERARKAEIERDELKDKVAQYEDWNRRLMEFMDMSEEERKAAIEEMKESARINGLLDTFCGGYAKMLGTFFLQNFYISNKSSIFAVEINTKNKENYASIRNGETSSRFVKAWLCSCNQL